MTKLKAKTRALAKRQKTQQPHPQETRNIKHTENSPYHKQLSRPAGTGVFRVVLRTRCGKFYDSALLTIDLWKHCVTCHALAVAEQYDRTLARIQLLALSDLAVETMTAKGDKSLAQLLALPEAPESRRLDLAPLVGGSCRVASRMVLQNGWLIGAAVYEEGLIATAWEQIGKAKNEDAAAAAENKAAAVKAVEDEGEAQIEHSAVFVALPTNMVGLLDVRPKKITLEDARGAHTLVLHYLPKAAAEHMLQSGDPDTSAAAHRLLYLPAAQPGEPESLIVAGIARRVIEPELLPNGWAITDAAPSDTFWQGIPHAQADARSAIRSAA